MVMPLIHESRPRCHVCCESFENIEALREHMREAHAESARSAESGPAPGDVSVF